MAQVAALAGGMALTGALGMIGQPTVKHNAPELGTSASYIAPPGDPNSSSTSSERTSGKKRAQNGQNSRGSKNATPGNGINDATTLAAQQQMLILLSSSSVLVFLCMGVFLAFAIAS